MTKKLTNRGCLVETTCVIQPNGTYTENVVLSVDPLSNFALSLEESAGRSINAAPALLKKSIRVRSTKHGFEVVER